MRIIGCSQTFSGDNQVIIRSSYCQLLPQSSAAPSCPVSIYLFPLFTQFQKHDFSNPSIPSHQHAIPCNYRMDKIYQCEDSIEQAKFLLASLHIDSGFTTITSLFKRKKLNYHLTFMHQLKICANRKLLSKIETPFKRTQKTLDNITLNKKRTVFRILQLHGEMEERRNAQNLKKSRESKELRRSNERLESEPSHQVKPVFVIDEEDWRDKMSLEELQTSCDYYSAKIKEVEKSFTDFFRVIQKD